MLPSDERSTWDARLLDDPRVASLWDRDLAISKWVAETSELGIDPFGPVVYDAFVLFGPEARWEAVPSDVLSAGLPVIGETSELASAIEPLLDSARPSSG